jgi:hypothetical protein
LWVGSVSRQPRFIGDLGAQGGCRRSIGCRVYGEITRRGRNCTQGRSGRVVTQFKNTSTSKPSTSRLKKSIFCSSASVSTDDKVRMGSGTGLRFLSRADRSRTREVVRSSYVMEIVRNGNRAAVFRPESAIENSGFGTKNACIMRNVRERV